MGYVLTFYSDNIYQDFLLPVMDNADYTLVLPWKTFDLQEDVLIHMEVVDGRWRFVRGEQYRVFHNGEDAVKKNLKDQELVTLTLSNNMKFAVMIREKENDFCVFRKYLLPPQGRIMIGKKRENQICYDSLGLVSGTHAAIEIGRNGYILRDLGSKNGVYVNHVRVRQAQMLSYGDTINIIGLKMVFLGSFLAIDINVPQIYINEEVLYPLEGGQIMDAVIADAPEAAPEEEKKYFNRTPRKLEQIDEEPFVIEAPPSKDFSRKQPWYLTVGPSMTMAIPMALGSVMAIMGGSGRSGVFMYTGLVTALGSAVIGTVWASVRMKNEKKNKEEDEAYRLRAYQEYLNEKEREISERYEKDMKILRDRYPAAEVMCMMGSKNVDLWNRNATHEDFMEHRLGLGALPFPSDIQIPEKRFSLHKDELAERPAEIQKRYQYMQQVPIRINLLKHPLVGIVGGRKKAGACEIARVLLTQIAANDCYTDVKIALTYDRNKQTERDTFEPFRWLPHTWSADKKIRYVADTPAEIADVYYELTQIIRERAEEGNNKESNGSDVIQRPLYVLFVSDPQLLKNELISKYVFNPSPAYGLITILMVERYEELPNSCEYIISNPRISGEFTGIYSVRGENEEKKEVQFDQVTIEMTDRFARELSNVAVEELEDGGEIPSVITFFEMEGVSRLEELDVATRWAKNRTYDSIRACLGQKAGGAPCYLDVHEKYHGPHGLVAGTTGSGKSETLETYILSLAVNYSPDDIGFFIIDYKGGGMANLFSGLPHMMGQISNLSGNQIHRAMVSIKSENRRRQRIFNDHGVNNINSYTKLIKNNEAKIPVPHLFIIIDEFAELKREEPDFMRELISVAQVGRSLGVHLILATQKPSGTVDDNIWSNSKFRLCLRVQDRQDSSDMLHKPDAAYITQAGRGYLQVGNDELYELFQSGWSGAIYDEDGFDGKTEAVKMYTRHGRAAIVGNRLKMRQQERAKQQWLRTLIREVEAAFAEDTNLAGRIVSGNTSVRSLAATLCSRLNGESIVSESAVGRMEGLIRLCAESVTKTTDGKIMYVIEESAKRSIKLPEIKQKTQLDAVVEYLARVAQQRGFRHQFMLWLPVLPEVLPLEKLAGYRESSFAKGKWPVYKKWELKACIGRCDDPANQAQTTLEIDFASEGHMLVFGMVGTGKSTFLQTLIYSLSHRYNPGWVNFYCMDFSSNSLRGFEKLAHVGDLMYEDDMEKISRCFNMIEGILDTRKSVMKGGNYEQYVQVHGVEFPAIFLIIDQYSNFREKTGNIFEEKLIRISRDGASLGVFLVISASGTGLTEVPNNLARNIKNTICLEMGDKFQYTDLLHTTRIPLLPEAGIRGRGLVKTGEQILEYQTAVSVVAEDDYSRIDKIKEECAKLNRAWTGRRARAVPVIPEKPVLEDFLSLEETRELLADPYSLPLGYNTQDAVPYSLDLRSVFSYLVSGRAKTGKANALKVLMQMAAAKKMKVYVADFSGRLQAAAEASGAVYMDTDQKLYDGFTEWKTNIVEKNTVKKELEKTGEKDSVIYDKIRKMGQQILFIADLPEFLTHVYYPEKPVPLMAGFLENITEKGAGLGIYFVSAFTPENASASKGYKVFANLTAAKEGFHLGGQVSSQSILNFDYLPYKEQSKSVKPGIAMLPSAEGEGAADRVVIPLAENQRD